MEIILQEKNLYQNFLWQLPQNIYKKEGSGLLIAGNEQNKNEPLLFLQAVLETAPIYISWVRPKSTETPFDHLLKNLHIIGVNETKSKSLAVSGKQEIVEEITNAQVSFIGPGLSKNAETVELIWQIVNETNKTFLLQEEAVLIILMGLKIIKKEKGFEEMEEKAKKIFEKKIVILNEKNFEKLLEMFSVKEKRFLNIFFKIQEILDTKIILIQEKAIIISENKKIIKTEIPFNINALIYSGIFSALFVSSKKKFIESASVSAFLYKEIITKVLGESSRKIIDSDIINNIKNILLKNS